MSKVIYAPFMSYMRIAANAHSKMIEYINQVGRTALASDDFQNTADGQAIVVVVFSVIALECYIYNYASRKLGETFCKKHIETMNLHTKWVLIPRLATGKAIPSDHRGMELLQKLVKARNDVVHLKAVNLKPECREQQENKIRETNDRIFQSAVDAFQCIGELGEALYKVDPDEPGAQLLAEFLQTPKYTIEKKSREPDTQPPA